MADLLLELFSEEIPARMQAKAAQDLQRVMMQKLVERDLEPEDALKCKVFATPRRLALHFVDMPTMVPDSTETRKGPKVDAPEKAIEGFLKSVGMTRDEVQEQDTPKGKVLVAVKKKTGGKAVDIIPEIVEDVVRNFPWPKSMRWGSGSLRWVRPLHSILCVFDGAVVPFAVDHIQAGNETRGHRFMGPDAFTVSDFADYEAKLKAAKVILNGKDREASIKEQAEAAAKAAGLTLKDDPALIHEIAGLVEWPVVLTGEFEEEFLAVPPEVLVATMRKDQKYLALQDADGNLANKFLLTANLEAADGGTHIIDGNQRVLRARLADARFFWEQDLKTPLADRVPQLKDIVFHAKLGTVADKMDRVAALAREIAGLIGADADKAEQAARLAKADLVSAMVYEFPEVQGIIGQRLAEAEGMDADIATAIGGHYAPQGPGDACPTNPVTIAVSLADKIDTLTGFFAIDEKPTGSKDPFALRRAALGVIRIVLENKLQLDLPDLILHGYTKFDVGGAKDSITGFEALKGFVADRLKVFFRDSGKRYDLVNAAYAVSGLGNIARLEHRLEALEFLMDEMEESKVLLNAYRRASNILLKEQEKDKCEYGGDVAERLLNDKFEKELHRKLVEVSEQVAECNKANRFAEAITWLVLLHDPLENFMAAVHVNADDPALRENRLKLLAQIRDTLHQVADFSQIEG